MTKKGNPDRLDFTAFQARGADGIRAGAIAFARIYAPLARQFLAEEGSLAKVAKRFNELRIPTRKGAAWTSMAVWRVLRHGAGADGDITKRCPPAQLPMPLAQHAGS